SYRNQSVVLIESQHKVVNPANPGGALDDRVEDRLNVRRRTADNAEHLGRCRLMLQGFAQFRVALLDLLEQPHVLNRDHCLVGKSFEELNMLLGKRANLHPTDHDSPDCDFLTQQWRGNCAPNTETSGVWRGEIVLGLCCKVMNVNGMPVNYGSARYTTALDEPRFITFGNRD